MRVVCAQCGKEFKRDHYKVKEKNFCSCECWKAHHLTPVQCAWCGESFMRHSVKPNKRYCGKECVYAARRHAAASRPTLTEKACNRCGEILPATTEYFRAHSCGVGGLDTYCRKCAVQRAAEWREANRERYNELQRTYRERHRQEIREAKLATYWANPGAARKVNRERGKRWGALRRLTDPRYRLNHSISSMVWRSLKQAKGGLPWESLVGYTAEELRRHLESMFEPGMSWENYGRGGWEVDHVRPRVSFAITSPDDPDFRACWALSNLQPLWGRENRMKHARFPGSERGESVASS